MGLRLREGVALEAVETALNRRAVARLVDQGLLAEEEGRLRALPSGMLVLDAILAEISA
jgi:coproporphyrinogen III oxidase-like Fe-S oxidoreductase